MKNKNQNDHLIQVKGHETTAHLKLAPGNEVFDLADDADGLLVFLREP